ncbi:helix-turn-helix transcriptional regulator [Sphingobacterium sp. HSC-15S19]|uniref:helix-turn-helix transcriptional regulator n=1 Tax=Sphingobacterium sp. HSC-15S19 TaxID=2910971 RepID=UPI003D255BD9
MKTILLYSFILVSLVLSGKLNHVYGQSVAEISAIENPVVQLEAVLLLPIRFDGDTIKLRNALAPVFELADKKRNIALKWAYYMRMADGFSIAFDRINSSSERYYRLAEQLLRVHPDAELEMLGCAREGYYNFVYRRVKEAFPFFLRANDLKSKVNIKKIPLVVKHYQFMASFYSYIGDQANAVVYLEEALPFTKPASRERVDLINSIAVYLAKDSLNHQAFSYLNRAMDEAKLAKDSVWIGIISGNLADHAWRKGEREKAIALVKKNIALSMHYNERTDAMRANLNLANWYIELKEWKLAEQYTMACEHLMEDKPYFLKYKMELAKSKSNIMRGLGREGEELKQLHLYLMLKDSLEKRTNDKEIQKMLWQRESEKYNRTIQATEEKRIRTKRMYQFIGIVLMLIFAIVVLLVNKSKIKIKMRNTLLEKDQLALAYEKQLLDQELMILRNSLTEFTGTIRQNDVIIQQLRQEVVKISESDPAYLTQVTDNLNALLQQHIMTDERWQKFKHVFNKVYPAYLTQMRQTYPKITENDLKILALLKLDLSNASMSELLCVSVEAVRKAKQRLKKKLEQTEK